MNWIGNLVFLKEKEKVHDIFKKISSSAEKCQKSKVKFVPMDWLSFSFFLLNSKSYKNMKSHQYGWTLWWLRTNEALMIFYIAFQNNFLLIRKKIIAMFLTKIK